LSRKKVACQLADVGGTFPIARGRVTQAGLLGCDVLAERAADTSFWRPDAVAGVVACRFVLAIEILALHLAGTRSIRVAHGFVGAGGTAGERCAGRSATCLAEVPHAVGVGIAGRRGVVLELAAFGALAVGDIVQAERINLTLGLAFGSRHVVLRASIAALRPSRVPSASKVGVAAGGVLIAVEALREALVDLPLANGRSSALGRARDAVALHGARDSNGVPEARRVGVASGAVGGIRHAALGRAAGSIPVAETARRASDVVGVGGAALFASGAGPEAIGVGVAAARGRVLHDAEVRADASDADEAVGIRHAEGAVDAVGRTLLAAQVGILVPLAGWRIDASRLSGDKGAGTAADAGRSIPRAVGVVVAVRLGLRQEVAPADAAARLERPHAEVLAFAAESVRKQVAGSAASLQSRIEHAAGVSKALRFVGRHRVLSGAGTDTNGVGRVPAADRNARAVVLKGS